MTVQADGGFSLTLFEPGQPPDLRFGLLTIENGKDVVLRQGDADRRPDATPIGEGEVFLEGDQMALLFDEVAGIEADIDGDGSTIPVTLLLVLERL